MSGSLLAVILYKLIKALEYESANPDPELGPAPPSVMVVPVGRNVSRGRTNIEQMPVASGNIGNGPTGSRESTLPIVNTGTETKLD